MKEGYTIFIRPPVEKHDNKGTHDIEFRVVEVIKEQDCVKLEDKEVEKENKGNTNATNANENATTLSNIMPTPHTFTQEDCCQVF